MPPMAGARVTAAGHHDPLPAATCGRVRATGATVRRITRGRGDTDEDEGARVSRWARVALVALLVIVLPTGAFAQDSEQEAREQASELQRQAEEAERRAEELADATADTERLVDGLAGDIASVEANLADARAEMDRVDAELQEAGNRLADAELKADKADARAEQARAESEKADAELARTREELEANDAERASAVRSAYMYGPGIATPQMAALSMAEGTSPTDIADVVHMLDVILVDHSLLVDESLRLSEAAEILATRAAEAKDRAEDRAAEAAGARDDAAERHAEVLVLMGEVEQAVAAEQAAIAELEDRRAEAEAQVARLDAAREEAEGQAARRSEQAGAALERAEELAAEAAAAAAAAEAAAAAAAAAAAIPAAPSGVSVNPISGGLARVGGITVAASIAPQVEALLNAARADGIVLGGYGYRSVETTIRLRRANGCPDVWTSPPSSCRVPTARPGTSMHERGLAIDFTYNGRTICYPNPPSRCYGNPAFDWLQANAGRFGLRGLSSEAWHYSTNGR